MAKSPSCFNLYWGWLLIFLGSNESEVADPMIEAKKPLTSIVRSVALVREVGLCPAGVLLGVLLRVEVRLNQCISPMVAYRLQFLGRLRC
jgi:hypothetical protein